MLLKTADKTPDNTEPPYKNEEKPTEDKTPEETKKETVYDLKCRSSSEISWKTVNFNDELTNATVTFTVPNDWEFAKTDDNTYTPPKSTANPTFTGKIYEID